MSRNFKILLAILLAFALHACGAKDESVENGEASVEVDAHQSETVEEGLVWMNYAEGMDRAAAQNKYVLVDFWTSWCHWCKVMDKDTYSNEAVQAKLIESFVVIKVDAESKTAQGGVEAPSGVELAHQFQVSSYPTTWFTDASGRKIAPLPGFSPPDQFLVVLDFIATGAYESQNFQEFQASRNKG